MATRAYTYLLASSLSPAPLLGRRTSDDADEHGDDDDAREASLPGRKVKALLAHYLVSATPFQRITCARLLTFAGELRVS